MSDIFISYRRKPSIDRAIRLKELLEKQGFTVYLDTQMGAGQFDDILIDEIRKCTYFLLLITDDTFDRCWEEEDIFRMEIECAKYNGKKIIPILNPGYQFPEKMPASINFLRYCNGIEITPHLLDSCVDDLVNRMLCSQTPLKKASAPVPGSQINDITNSLTKQYIYCPRCNRSVLLFRNGKHHYLDTPKKASEYAFDNFASSIYIPLVFLSLFVVLLFSHLSNDKPANFIVVTVFCLFIVSVPMSLIFGFISGRVFMQNWRDIRRSNLQVWKFVCLGCSRKFSYYAPLSEKPEDRVKELIYEKKEKNTKEQSESHQ